MKIFVVKTTEVSVDDGDVTIKNLGTKAFANALDAAAEVKRQYDEAVEEYLDIFGDCDEDEEIPLDGDGYTEDGYGRAQNFGNLAEVSTWGAGDGNSTTFRVEIDLVEAM